MKLAVISSMRGCKWAGSETVWHMAALLALEQHHEVTAILHPDLSSSQQVKEFIRRGGKLVPWTLASMARLQSLRDRILPTFPQRLLESFDAILVSLGSPPTLCQVPGLAGSLLRSNAPLALFCQGNADHHMISPSERDTVAAVMGRSSACVFLSRRNLDQARRQFAVDPPGATVLGNPIRNGIVGPLPWPSTSTGTRFASVARFDTAWKGQDILLDILSRPAWQDRPWHLSFYGSGPDLAHLQRLVTLFKLGDRVTFAGFVHSLEDVWRDNHVLLLPSHGEGLPLVVLEAMMLGRPVITTDVGGNREVIEEGVTGFVADGSTPHAFGETLERAWQLRERWPAMGQHGHAKAVEMTKANPTQQLLDVWKGIGSDSRRSA